jgi:predicted nucleic acid-binding protein
VNFLIDTTVLFAAKRGAPKAVKWLQAAEPESRFFSVITIGAIIKAQPDLDDWLEQLTNSYAKRILPVDAVRMRVARRYDRGAVGRRER